MTRVLTQSRKQLDKQAHRLLHIHKTSADLLEQIIRLNPQTEHANNTLLTEMTKSAAAEIEGIADEVEILSKALKGIIDCLTHPRGLF